MKELFKKARVDALIYFLKEVGLYGKIQRSDNSENYWIKLIKICPTDKQ